jgi:hypothetical protein
MSKTADTKEPLQLVFDKGYSRPMLRRIQAYPKEARAAAETPEAKERRKQCEAERREWSLEIFNKKRWSRDEALIWIAYPDRHSLARSKRAAVLYDHDLPDREPSALLTEAITNKRIAEYTDGRRTWYLSEQVKAVFPEVGQHAPPSPTVEEVKAEPIEAANLAEGPTEVVTNNTTTTPKKAPSRKVLTVANKLKSLYPDGPPTKKYKDLGRDLKVSDSTVKRAFLENGWSRRRAK